MASFTFELLQQNQLQLLSFRPHCKYSSSLNTFKFHYTFNGVPFSPTEHKFDRRFSPFLPVSAHVAPLEAKLQGDAQQAGSRNSRIGKVGHENHSAHSPSVSRNRSVNETCFTENFDVVEESIEKRVILRDRYAKTRLHPDSRRKTGSPTSSLRSNNENFVASKGKTKGRENFGRKMERKSDKDRVDHSGEEKARKGSKKGKTDTPEMTLRVGLEMCSKRGDVMDAIRLYDLASKEGIMMGQYHYAVLLYLCSSAATGVVQPAKSGSSGRSLNQFGPPSVVSDVASGDSAEAEETRKLDNGSSECLNVEENDSRVTMGEKKSRRRSPNGTLEPYPETVEEMVQFMKFNAGNSIKGGKEEQESWGIKVNEDIKRCALKRGFEIYGRMRLEKVPMNEATFTSLARMAMSLGDGDMAFHVVHQMKELGITPRLRSYGPALSVFCSNGDVEKAFEVEQHMLEHGVYPEEPELEALLRVSVEVGRSDKVYYLLHKLRTSVRQVSPSTADTIEKWFSSKFASRVGKKKWDKKLIKEVIARGGGGWHGQGWLGKGRWTVSRTYVGSDGLCKFCGEKLVTIDLDPAETENFARSVASIAAKRERNSSFQKFQKWLDYYGPFEAVIDAANVGLYSQRKFRPSKVNAIANGIRQMLPSRKWPLIVLHNRRITGDKMEEPVNKALIEKWKTADALFATPTGSNDDWYWLYAAIKFKGLIITNDEMRDHLFHLLGNDFFPKWKERHQVRFSFSETGPVFHMPPPCSIVIQETEEGHWHIPVISDSEALRDRTWLCITRSNLLARGLNSSDIQEELQSTGSEKNHVEPRLTKKTRVKQVSEKSHVIHGDSKQAPQEIYKNLRNILSLSLLPNHSSILQELEAAEELGGCTIDFQI